MALRMTFGGSPCPAMWGYISDTLIDISNTLIHNKHWNHESLFDPISLQINEPKPLPDSIPFAQAKEIYFDLPQNNIGISDIYIDDSIGIAPDIDNNVR